jgi:hypothetical protein
LLALLLSLIFVATFHLAHCLLTDPSEPVRCQRYRLSDAASCGDCLPSELMSPPALEVALDLIDTWSMFAACQEPSQPASRAALVVSRHLSGLGFATPPGILQPDLGFEVHNVSARRFPDNRSTEALGFRWESRRFPHCVPTLRRLTPRRQLLCLTTLPASLPFTVLMLVRTNEFVRPGRQIRVPTSPPDNDADASRPPTEVRSR